MTLRIEPDAEPIAGYKLIERLGRGGFGEVWKAEAPGGLLKAIKFVYGDVQEAVCAGEDAVSSGDETERAGQELKALARVKSVRHPYILSLERYDIIDGRLVVVMELADRNLWDRFRECRVQGLRGIPREELLRYMVECAEALDLMNHGYQLQHLDIKPQNLFLVHNHVKVADFGLVKDLEGMRASVTGGVTPVYASPETFDGWVSRFCDQYSLAIVYQELLTGQRPFDGGNVRQLIMQHISADPDVSPLPEEDRTIIWKALSKEPDERFPNCTDFVCQLQSAQPKTEQGAPSGPVVPQANPPSDQGDCSTSIHIRATPSSHNALRSTPHEEEMPTEEADGTRTLSKPLSAHAQPKERNTHREIRTQRRAPREIQDDGILFPTLFLGLGQTGLDIVQQLRSRVHEEIGDQTSLPWRFLVLDTDPEIVREATKGEKGESLDAHEILLAPLQRPSYYMRGRSDRPPLEAWLPQKMLFRIPRSLHTGGVRALGRLAFVENYRTIRRRLRQELDACLDQELFDKARESSLGVRTNRPRVYIACGLAGGTGSGLFLDAAYSIRQLLQEEGYEQPDIVGLFLMPTCEPTAKPTETSFDMPPVTNTVQPMSVMDASNGYAALRELFHYGSKETRFEAIYDRRDREVIDDQPPFGRCLILPCTQGTNSKREHRRAVARAGSALYEEVAGHLGKLRDLTRRANASSDQTKQPTCETVGLFTVSQPQKILHREAAVTLCSELVGRWTHKEVDMRYGRDSRGRKRESPLDSSVYQEALAKALETVDKVSPEELKFQLEEALRTSLHKEPETALLRLTEPLVREYITSASSKETRSATALAKSFIPFEEVEYTFGQLVDLVGETTEDVGQDRLIGTVEEILERVTSASIDEWGQKLASKTVELIELPGSRLGGSEKYCQKAIEKLEAVLQKLEPRSQKLTTQASDLCERIQTLLRPEGDEPTPEAGSLVSRLLQGSARQPTQPTALSVRTAGFPAVEIVEWLRSYGRLRLESLLCRAVCRIFLTLKGGLLEEMREVGSCRLRLSDLQQRFTARQSFDAKSLTQSPDEELLFDSQTTNAQTALEQVLADLPEDYLLAIDHRVQDLIRAEFTALVDICVGTENRTEQLESAMLKTVEEYLAETNPGQDIAETFRQLVPDAEARLDRIDQFLKKADPPTVTESALEKTVLEGSKPTEMFAFSIPPGEAGDEIVEQVRYLLSDVELVEHRSPGPIRFCRERTNIPLEELQGMNEFAREAYEYLLHTDHFTPHSRADVPFDIPLE